MAGADEIEREIAEEYLELPRDEGGVPIAIGDVMVGSAGTAVTVIAVSRRSFYLRNPGGEIMRLGAGWHKHAEQDPAEPGRIPFEKWDDMRGIVSGSVRRVGGLIRGRGVRNRAGLLIAKVFVDTGSQFFIQETD